MNERKSVEAALPHLLKAIGRYEELGMMDNSFNGVDILQHAADCFRACGDLTSALSYTSRALSIVRAFDQSNNQVLLLHAGCEIAAGKVFSDAGRTTEAKAAYETALSIARRCGDESSVILASIGMARALIAAMQVTEALDLLDAASALCNASASSTKMYECGLVVLYSHRGDVLSKLGRHEDAARDGRLLLELCERLHGVESPAAATARANIGISQIYQGDLTGAMENNQLARAMYKRLGMQRTKAFANAIHVWGCHDAAGLS